MPIVRQRQRGCIPIRVHEPIHEHRREEAVVESLKHKAVVWLEKVGFQPAVVVRAATKLMAAPRQWLEELVEGGAAVRVRFPHDNKAPPMHACEETRRDQRTNTVRNAILQMNNERGPRVGAHDCSHNSSRRSPRITCGRSSRLAGALCDGRNVGLEKERPDQVVYEAVDGRAEAAAWGAVRRRTRHGCLGRRACRRSISTRGQRVEEVECRAESGSPSAGTQMLRS